MCDGFCLLALSASLQMPYFDLLSSFSPDLPSGHWVVLESVDKNLIFGELFIYLLHCFLGFVWIHCLLAVNLQKCIVF